MQATTVAHPLSLLVIEDDDVDLEKIKRLLCKGTLSVNVVAATSSNKAIEFLNVQTFDCAILDYQLQDGLGSALLHRIKNHRQNPTPVIMISGNSDERVIADIMREGAFDYISKRQLDAETLISTLEASLLWAESTRLQQEDQARVHSLAHSEQLFHAAFDYAPLGMVLINMQGIIIQTNPALRHLLGYDNEGTTSTTSPTRSLQKIGDLFSPDDIASILAELEKLYNGNQLFSQYETRCQTKDGNHIPTMINAAYIKEFSGEPCYLLQIYDLSERKRYEYQLIKLAHFDSLTGLGNREKMNREIEFLIRKSHHDAAPFAVIFGDLDHFKQINDGLGHEAGDILLKTVARRLQKSLRHEDIICRLGGDEFVILLTNIPHFESVVCVAEKLLQKIHKPIRLGKNRVHVGMSFGIALYPTDGDDAKTLLRNADSALYDAKAKGRGCYQLYRKELTEYVHSRLLLDADLRKAIINHEFELHYQPIIDLATNKVISAEVLIRWNHPQRGRVPPDEFIPYAQESGLIIPIGDWTINDACRQLAQWQAQGVDINLSINISARQFIQQNLLQLFTQALEKYHLRGDQLTLEITEQMFLENTENNVKKISELKNLGIKISLDDFGTGYSSLSYIMRFAPQYLKIDSSFVSLIGTGKEHDAMVNAIIGLNKIIPMHIIGQGIEEEHQRYFLCSHGCDLGQGYLFSHPLPAEQFLQFLHIQQNLSQPQMS